MSNIKTIGLLRNLIRSYVKDCESATSNEGAPIPKEPTLEGFAAFLTDNYGDEIEQL